MSKREPRQTKRERSSVDRSLAAVKTVTFASLDECLTAVEEWGKAEHASGRKLGDSCVLVTAKDPTKVIANFASHELIRKLANEPRSSELATHLSKPSAPDSLRVLVSDASGERCLAIKLSTILEANHGR